MDEKILEKLGLPTEQKLSDEQKAVIVKKIIRIFEDEKLTYGQCYDLIRLVDDALGNQVRFVKLVER